MKLYNYTLRTLSHLKDDQDTYELSWILAHLKAKNQVGKIQLKNPKQLKFGDVWEMKKKLKTLTFLDQLNLVARCDQEVIDAVELLDMKKPTITPSDYKKEYDSIIDKKIEEYLSMQAFEFYHLFNYVVECLKQIIETENSQLAQDPDIDEIDAGVENLSRLGVYLTLDNLSGGDVLKWDSIYNTSYNRIFTKLLVNRMTNDYIKRLEIIKRKK